jgi:hypothetical protein
VEKWLEISQLGNSNRWLSRSNSTGGEKPKKMSFHRWRRLDTKCKLCAGELIYQIPTFHRWGKLMNCFQTPQEGRMDWAKLHKWEEWRNADQLSAGGERVWIIFEWAKLRRWGGWRAKLRKWEEWWNRPSASGERAVNEPNSASGENDDEINFRRWGRLKLFFV